MDIKVILAPLSGSEEDAAVLGWADALAAAHGAKVDGLFARHAADSAFDFLGPGFSTYGVEALLESLDRAMTAAAERSREAFANVSDTRKGTLRERVGRPAAVAAEEARFADIAVTVAPQSGAERADWDQLEALAMDSGRGVFVVPAGMAARGEFQRVALAWDGGREAARAAAAAMPFLQRAERVAVISVGDRNLIEIGAWLNAHGVAADLRTVERDGKSTVDALLDDVDEFGADLLVLGAFGHARWPLPVQRGVTTRALNGATRPLLLAH